MSLDAQDWVWNHSKSTGNARLVILAVADKAPGPDCTARMGMTEFRRRLNAARSTAMKAIDKAIETGELTIVEDAIGSRAALYQLPHAVGHVRVTTTARGPKLGPVQGAEVKPPQPEQGAETRPGSENRRGPNPGPGGAEIRPPWGPNLGPHNQTSTTSQPAGSPNKQQQDDPYAIPDLARPLVDGCTNAGVIVRWPFVGNQWLIIHALIKKSGVQAMVDHARRASARTNVESAKYFMQGWRELPPLPAEPPKPRAAQRASKPPHCGHVDCDEITRTRDAHDAKGFPIVVPCPECHPNTRKDVAA